MNADLRLVFEREEYGGSDGGNGGGVGPGRERSIDAGRVAKEETGGRKKKPEGYLEGGDETMCRKARADKLKRSFEEKVLEPGSFLEVSGLGMEAPRSVSLAAPSLSSPCSLLFLSGKRVERFCLGFSRAKKARRAPYRFDYAAERRRALLFSQHRATSVDRTRRAHLASRARQAYPRTREI